MEKKYNLGIIILIFSFLLIYKIPAQFFDDFNIGSFNLDSTAMNGWWYYTGDGSASMKFLPADGFASILVDATKDQRNIWWALIRRYVYLKIKLFALMIQQPRKQSYFQMFNFIINFKPFITPNSA